MLNWLFGFWKKAPQKKSEVEPLSGQNAAVSDHKERAPASSALASSDVDQCSINRVATEISHTYHAWLFSEHSESEPLTSPPATPAISSLGSPPVSAGAEKQLKDLEVRLKSAKIEDLGLPRQPNILPKLMSVMKDKAASSDKLVALISSDAGFTVKVLSMANSPYFRVTEEPITDIKRALIYLGEQGLQRLVTTVLLQPILVLKSNASKSLSEMLYKHVFLCADIGSWLASESDLPPQNLHLLGLLQGTGNISLLSFMDTFRQESTANDEQDRRQGKAVREQLTDEETAWIMSQLFQRHSHRLAFIVARHWKLGAELESALAYVVQPGDPRYQNKTSELLLASVLATYVRLLHDKGVVDAAQTEAWLTATHISSDVLEKPFVGI